MPEEHDPIREAARLMGRKGGQVSSPAKTAANRLKAKLPRKRKPKPEKPL